MFANPPPANPAPTRSEGDVDPFVLYTQSLHDYTLQLWTESRRLAEEKARIRAAEIAGSKKQEGRQRQRADAARH
ncbi:hypothetical protein SCP_0105300 [Sparassis crispa]|uniref:Uncharacterized protein n=1 Tax=Sparassis crispa TaxID=139825 RepID=A0A401G657_9APHY|nr:hypothetical protein SCP_0105300 [Sparassis crispa]GBE77650.1 hypothetical protein SCP_0105300 [Sparassis crispa]